MNRILEHPVIANMERTGYPGGKEPHYPRCPVCGKECAAVHRNRYLEVIGCNACVSTVDAWECDDCFPEEG